MKHFWRKWTYEFPLFISDALWNVLVVEFAAFLDRLTFRQVITFIPVLVLIVAYAHSIPIPPELMLVGDVLAYIDIFSVILLLSMMSRAAAILFVVKQSAEQAARFASGALAATQRLNFRHRREPRIVARKRRAGPRRSDDDGAAVVGGFAWA